MQRVIVCRGNRFRVPSIASVVGVGPATGPHRRCNLLLDRGVALADVSPSPFCPISIVCGSHASRTGNKE